MTLEESLKALKSAFTSKTSEAEKMSAEISQLKADKETLNAEFLAVTEKLEASAAFAKERDDAIAKVEELTKALASSETIKKEAVEQIETVGKKSASIAASVGVSPVEISSADAVAFKTPAETWQDYLSIQNPAEKQAFYNKNRASIVAHLGIK